MRCPYCGASDTKVIDSRPSDDDLKIRRRRECIVCAKRFTTYEAIETTPLILVKKNGERELFDRDKLLKSMLKACEKRPISAEQLSGVCDRVEKNLLNHLEKEIPTKIVGELVMDELKQIDKVAYIRFASVYRDFRDIETFLKAINEIQSE